MNLTEALTHHIGYPVTLTFSDHGTEAGTLLGVAGDTVMVDTVYTTGDGHTHHYTAEYTVTGDDDTPHVTGVRRVAEQSEALW